ncbi:MAG: SCP2 sterol-binding domain-containing protein [Gammaproteobacteria bacterium]|nr:MAG: SCP2 sterol-binding domain-containing protein [Gammaproteobacteria bacterium]
MSSTSLLSAVLERAFNRYIQLDECTPQKLAVLEGNIIAVEIKYTSLVLYLDFQHGNVFIHESLDGEPQARIIASPVALMRLGAGADSSDLMFHGEMEIQGDTDLGQQFKHILEELDIDWEEQISRLAGDALAHRISHSFQQLVRWGKETRDIVALDTAEYLQQESGLLPMKAEIDELLSCIDELRSDTDRLEARIRRLHDKAIA